MDPRATFASRIISPPAILASAGLQDGLFKNGEPKIVAQRSTDAVCAIGKCFMGAGLPVAAALILSDQRFALLHHCYFRARHTSICCKLFCVCKQVVTKPSGLEFKRDGQHRDRAATCAVHLDGHARTNRG
jgi:hypothetical protein